MASEPKFVTFVQEYEGDVKSEKPYVWNLVSGDGTKLAFAPGRYGSQQGALNAIESIQTRAPYNREDFTEDWGPRGYSWKLKKGETDLAVSPGIFATRAELEASIGLVISALPGSKYRLAEIESRTQSKSRIGLALSGGGFRASLFHLGVIRRLEELGIMQDVAVISCISGGSIIGAYYTVEMQNRLRPFLAQHKDKLDNVDEDFLKKLNKERLRLFVRIADDFFRAIDKNIRTRAFFFPYFYHPVEFLKRLIPFLSAKTRGEWIRLEYDKHLFHGADMDQLPAYNLERMPEEGHLRIGPKVYINASSLLSGELVPFAREQVVGFDEMRKPNTNVAKLSHIVGASSAFPGLIPPIAYAGDVLVDGGNNDNQALKIFIGHQRHLAPQRIPHEEVDVLLVSDGSGQIAQLDSIGTDGKSVLPRVVNVLTHEVRNRNLEEIAMWKDMAKTQRQFAYIQLYRSLKDREHQVGSNRVPSEYISALGDIRTDLDQFSPIEREALMYHGYTLIDNQLRQWCKDFLGEQGLNPTEDSRNLTKGSNSLCKEEEWLRKPPLFQEKMDESAGARGKLEDWFADRRTKTKEHLTAGSGSLLTVRLWKLHPWFLAAALAALGGIAYLVMRYAYPYVDNWVEGALIPYLLNAIVNLIPKFILNFYQELVDMGILVSPITETGLTMFGRLAALVVFLYVLIGILVRIALQHFSLFLDRVDHYRLAKGAPSQGGKKDDEEEEMKSIVPWLDLWKGIRYAGNADWENEFTES